jgi:A/G-specific adenine glycosylase
MDLGSSICTPKNPHCVQCPWLHLCKAAKIKKTHLYPVKKPKKSKEFWLWNSEIILSGKYILLAKNSYAPFLKGGFIPPGKARCIKAAPRKFDFRHSITHHDIYIQVNVIHRKNRRTRDGIWIHKNKLSEKSPYSLVQKALKHAKFI